MSPVRAMAAKLLAPLQIGAATPHRPLIAANKQRDHEEAVELLAARLDRKFPSSAHMRSRVGVDAATGYDVKREKAQEALTRALEEQWREGLDFTLWANRAARAVSL